MKNKLDAHSELISELQGGGGGFGGILGALGLYRARVMRERAGKSGYDSNGLPECEGLDATDQKHGDWQLISTARSWVPGKMVSYYNCGRCGRTL